MQRKSSAMSEQETVVIIVITKHQYVRRRCRESLCYDPESILNKSRDNEVHLGYARQHQNHKQLLISFLQSSNYSVIYKRCGYVLSVAKLRDIFGKY